MIQRKITYLLFSSVMFLSTGCDEKEKGTSSQELDTNQLFVNYRVVSYGNNLAEVSAAFSYLKDVYWGSLPDSRTVRLEGDDQLTVEVAGQAHGFNQEEIDRQIVYTALVEVGDEETDFKVIFDRPSRFEHNVTDVILPAAMEITEPVENQVYSINDSINLKWTPVDENQAVSVCINTSCFQEVSDIINICTHPMQETGEYITTILELSDRFGPYTLIDGSSCTAELHLYRSRSGTVSPEYRFANRIFARRERIKHITINLN